MAITAPRAGHKGHDRAVTAVDITAITAKGAGHKGHAKGAPTAVDITASRRQGQGPQGSRQGRCSRRGHHGKHDGKGGATRVTPRALLTAADITASTAPRAVGHKGHAKALLTAVDIMAITGANGRKGHAKGMLTAADIMAITGAKGWATRVTPRACSTAADNTASTGTRAWATRVMPRALLTAADITANTAQGQGHKGHAKGAAHGGASTAAKAIMGPADSKAVSPATIITAAVGPIIATATMVALVAARSVGGGGPGGFGGKVGVADGGSVACMAALPVYTAGTMVNMAMNARTGRSRKPRSTATVTFILV